MTAAAANRETRPMSFLPSGVAPLALPVPPSQHAAAGYRSQELLTIDILDEVDVSEFMATASTKQHLAPRRTQGNTGSRVLMPSRSSAVTINAHRQREVMA